MKKINELTDSELVERLEMLKELDTHTTKALRNELQAEINNRHEAKKAEEEKRAKEEAEKKKELAIKEKQNEQELYKKQTSILGNYYLIDGVAYHVKGIVGDTAVLEHKYTYQCGNSYSSRDYTVTKPLDYVIDRGDEITKEEYQENVANCKCKKQTTEDLFGSLFDAINPFFGWKNPFMLSF